MRRGSRHTPEVRARMSGPVLSRLTEQERADYDTLKKAGFARAEALAAIRRSDLLPVAAE